MRQRRRLLLVLIAAAVLLVAAALVAMWPGSSINAETFERIGIGMAEFGVERLIGHPPGDYSTGPVVWVRPFRATRFEHPVSMGSLPPSVTGWLDNNGLILVKFADGRVPLTCEFARAYC
jgi:hypothetical protein